ncbi:MAG TPA: S53 family peptidase, partial [Geobacterales bacterium]|nr:S53 family peptidase [Geobacterales bacterium]
TSSTPIGYSPVQIRHAYGFDLLSCSFTGTFGSSNLCGYGQIIAIVDAYDDPNIENDLNVFSSQFGLPSCTSSNGCFIKAMPQGKPRADQGWALEISLDVEWAHAIAPGAKILLVEAKSNSLSNLLAAVDYAVSQGAKVVSMSWGGSEFSSESSYDYHFNVAGVSFFASSGDSGHGVIWPAASPYVIGVGGTTLNLDAQGNVLSETAWSGSGGGISAYEKEPSYQVNYGISSNGMRAVPDVAYDADPNTGFAVYDSYGYQGQKGWFEVGGTSAGAPQWAALTAIVDSGRSTPISASNFGSGTEIYLAATGSVYSTNFRDITSGTNGNCGSVCTASSGYDFVTGLGSPQANNLIPYLQTH